MLTKQDCIDIHTALHWGNPTVNIGGKELSFQQAKVRYRFLDIENIYPNGKKEIIRFQKQNKSKHSAYGRSAREGHLITWGIRHGKWILIMDGKVENL